MSETLKIFLTSGLTIIGGVLIYTMGQVISKFFIEPIHSQAKCIEKISHSLIFYANIYANVRNDQHDIRKKVSNTTRHQASILAARTNMIKFYRLFELLMLVPKRNDVEKAVGELIGLSNSIFPPAGEDASINQSRENHTSLENIKKLLSL